MCTTSAPLQNISFFNFSEIYETHHLIQYPLYYRTQGGEWEEFLKTMKACFYSGYAFVLNVG